MVNEYRAEIIDLRNENLDSFAELITQAFLSDEAAQKEGTSIVFDKTTFQRLFASPYLKEQLAIKVVHQESGVMVGFMGGLPRDMCLREKNNKTDQNKHIRVMVPSWAAVHSDHKRKGVGSMLVSKFIDAVSKLGFEYSYAMFEPEQNGIDLGNATADRHSAINTLKWFNINWFLIRVFDIPALNNVMKLKPYEKWIISLVSPPKTPLPKFQKNGENIRLYKPGDRSRIFELLDEYRSTKQAAIIKNKEDLYWYLEQPGIICCVHEDQTGTVDGFVLAWEFNFAGFGKIIPFGWLDLVNIDHLKRKSGKDLMRFFNIQAKKKDGKVFRHPISRISPFGPFYIPIIFHSPKK